MTDKTDIKALRVEIAELRLVIAKGYDSFIPETKIHIKLLERILDQLEAERQRADKSQDDMQFECDAHIETAESWREWKLRAVTAEAETSALWGTKEPVVVLTPPINPLMFNADVMFGYNKARAEDKVAIEAAGIVVKDGE